jgi:hypothetical protein
MTALLRRLLTVGLALAAWTCLTWTASSCPFCTMQGQTLTNEVSQASMVLYGSLENAQVSRSGDFNEGTTDLVIEKVVKNHEILGDKKVITLNRYVPVDKGSKDKFLVFCDVFKGKVDPYRGFPVKADSDIAKYLEGAAKAKDKPINERLRFFFDYLDDSDPEVSNDAYKEFGNADYKDYRAMVKDLPADKIAQWLQDPKTPNFRYGLYASMLGHSGKEEHAKLLRTLIDDLLKNSSSTTGLDGILAGYVLLKPKEGWDYLYGMLKDEKKEFTIRYAGLRTMRFFWESRPDVLEKKQVLEGIGQLLQQSDIADLAIEDLRKWAQWQMADEVLKLKDKPSHNIPIIRRSILRFALSCPEKPVAVAFVDELRKKDARLVRDAEELLKMETAVQSPKK